MSLPAELRNRLGLLGGGALLVEETSDGLMLRAVAQSVAGRALTPSSVKSFTTPVCRAAAIHASLRKPAPLASDTQ
jgi:hypothetical protein